MAEGGGEGDGHPLRRDRDGNRRPIRRQLSRDDIGNQARYLLTQFIHDRVSASGYPQAPASDSLIEPGTPSGPPVESVREVASALRKIGDELDGDERLQGLIAQIPPDAPRMTFAKVAAEIFADGNFNWGRVVALFYFAFKMAVKAIESSVSNSILVIRSIVEWVVSFIVDNVATWILDRGGWEAIQEYFGTPTVQAAGILLAGVICSLTIVWWNR